ncbi:glycosyltransferase [Vibrio clamense]|uniref:glycosyltransferase n=1 Tax=Vibrio clamense TaxID=2910254 RepID=UPI003D1EFA94
MNKKFLLIHLFDDYSGSPKVLSSFINVLKKNGVLFDVFIGSGSKGFINSSSTTSSFLYKRSNCKLITLFFYLVSQFVLFFKVLKWIYNNKKEDKIILVNTLLPFGAALAGKMCNVEVNYYLHEVSISPKLLNFTLVKVMECTSSYNLFVSDYVKGVYTNLPGCVIYNCADPMYETINLTDDALYNKWLKKNVLLVCSLKTYKGYLSFIEIAKENDFLFTLILNCSQSDFHELNRGLDLPPNIDVVFRPQKLADYYIDSFLVFNLSDPQYWIETFGLTILEGMFSYSPIICPQIGGPAELVRDNCDGWHISFLDKNRISSKLSYLSKDYDKWLCFSRSARSRAEEFSNSRYEYEICRTFSIYN